MQIAVLSNIFEPNGTSHKEVEDDLMEFSTKVKTALEVSGHDVTLMDINESAFEKLRKSKINIAFNVCERINGMPDFEPNVASMLEILNIPFTGSSSFTLALCLHKAKVKDILNANNIPTPNHQIFYYPENIDLKLDFPVIVKPECSHNSIGIHNNAVAKDMEELKNNIYMINKELNQNALVEEFVPGREFAIGILGNKDPIILPLSEVVYNPSLKEEQKFLSYSAKWCLNSKFFKRTPIFYDIQLHEELKNKISKIAMKCYKILDLRDYGTVEIRLDNNNEPMVLEVNPNPGLSCHSVIPKIFENIGKDFNELAIDILNNAMKRYNL